MEKKYLPVIPLRGLYIFPKVGFSRFNVGRTKSLNALKKSKDFDGEVLLVNQIDINGEATIKNLKKVGIIAKITEQKKNRDVIEVTVDPIVRAKINQITDEKEIIFADCSPIKNEKLDENDLEIRTMLTQIRAKFETLSNMNKSIMPRAKMDILSTTDVALFIDKISQLTIKSSNDLDKLLCEDSLLVRINLVNNLLTKEIEMAKLEDDINRKVQESVDKSQKEFYLREKMKAISEELDSGEGGEFSEIEKKIENTKLPDYAREKINKEFNRLKKLPSVSPDYTVITNYLDLALSLPWGVYDESEIDIKKASQILNEDHYGMEKIKDRILEYLSVLKLTKKSKGPILCFVGPPGVGKTSIVQSIARALGRKFVRMSLGGIHDEAEIRGHRKTYVGAMTGRVLSNIQNAKTSNPVFLFDEIDKLASDYKGDPASALLEVLDPEQNSTFRDNFLEMPFDLSDVVFVCTANSTDTIPRPLLDRMELIELSGYTDYEKLQIAKNFIVKKVEVNNGLKAGTVSIKDDAITTLIEEYTRESGVRNLEREISNVVRKSIRRMLEGDGIKKKISVAKKDIYDLLGKPIFVREKLTKENEVGVATGLAWTVVGGETLNIEVTLYKGKGEILLTGKLGDVMKESARIAISLVRSNAKKYGIKDSVFESTDIHLHVPEGAIPKDGPSAGITIATAILSAFTNKKVKGNLAMTGEITLRGNVLPIGGVKEKCLAAYRAGITNIILPSENKKDLEDIPKEIQSKIKFTFVSKIDDVFKNAYIK